MKVCKKCDLEKEETLFNKGRGECKDFYFNKGKSTDTDILMNYKD